MEQFEFCYIDLVKNEKCLYTSEGLIATELKKDKESGLTKKQTAAAEVAKAGLEGWELVSVVNDTKFRLFFKREVKAAV
jgi:hypothetical protein